MKNAERYFLLVDSGASGAFNAHRSKSAIAFNRNEWKRMEKRSKAMFPGDMTAGNDFQADSKFKVACL